MMEGVVQRGTGRAVAAVGKPVAGKTGTSSEAKDTWFIGFSPDLAAGVFVGFDNPRSLGRVEQGATVAAPIFRDFMEGALQGVPPTPFRIAPGIELISIDEKAGTLTKPGAPGSILEAFKAGTEPGGPNAPGANMDIGGAVPAAAAAGLNPSDIGEGTGGLY
jgi:penicillin-binding protein 1A